MRVQKVRPGAVLPAYQTAEAAGADLCACLEEPVLIPPGETRMIPIGLAFEIPKGVAGLVFARSGLASKRDLAPANKVGVIDPDYRGEVFVPLHNHGTQTQEIVPQERIAQLLLIPFLTERFILTESLDETVRGEGGFGSTGA